MYGLSGDDNTINYETAWEEVNNLEEILKHGTGDKSISIGIYEHGKYECEYWVESNELRQACFTDLDKVEAYIRENYLEWND